MTTNTNDSSRSGCDSTTPLHEAAARGDLDGVKVLIQSGADVASLNTFRATPLHLAANSDVAIVECLLAHGASVGAQDSFGNTPLHYAALRGKYLCAAQLLKSGADPSIVNFRGKRPLDLVQGDSHDKATKLLIQLLCEENSPNMYR